MSEDINQYAMKVFEAASSKRYSDKFFEHVERALSNEYRLERIAKTFQLPEGTAKSVLTQACKIYLDANNEEKVERYARGIVNYAARAGTLDKLFNLAEDSLSQGANKVERMAHRFHIPAHLTHNVFNRACEIVSKYTETFEEPQPAMTAVAAAGQCAGE